MALIKKGPSAKKKLTLTLTLLGSLIATVLILYFGVFRSAPTEVPTDNASIATSLERQKQESVKVLTLSGNMKELVEFLKAAPQWQALRPASQLATTTPDVQGRNDPFEVISGLDINSAQDSGNQ